MSSRYLLAVVLVSAAACDRRVVEGIDVHSVVMNGAAISGEETAALEDRLVERPGDIAARTTLLGYYFHHRFVDPAARKAHQRHVLWLIRNAPESEILSTPFGGLDASRDGEAYAQGKKAWLEQIEDRPESVVLLGHASKFLTLQDRELAIELVRRAAALDTGNPKWPARLGQLYALDVTGDSGEVDTNLAEKALEQYERAYEMSEEGDREFLLADLAKLALAAKQTEKATEYAESMLRQNDADWNQGNNVHHGNLVLGRIALEAGDIEKAKRHLLQAGRTAGSPQLNSFGPNMNLARELLQRGEREVVLEYLALCGKFWHMGQERLATWSSLVEEGKTPDFGPNMVY